MNASDPGDKSTRVEREIREILERAESDQSPVENLQDAIRRKRASPSSMSARTAWAGSRWLSSNRAPEISRILGALLLAIAAAMVADVARFIAMPLAIASAAVFLSLWVPSRPSGPGETPRWRGQRLDGDTPGIEFGQGRTPPWRWPRGQ